MKFEYGKYDDLLKECAGKFGGLLGLPIIRRSPYREMVGQYQKGNVLDLGAGKKKPLREMLNGKMNAGRYYSLDTDPKGEFDFGSIEDVPADLKFDLVTANQFFEHLTVDESIELLGKVAARLNAGGAVIATVPNIAHPTRQISNVTHKTPWGFNSFYALFKMAGLEPKRILRYSKRHPRGPVEMILAFYMNRLYRMDYCDSIMLIAEKK